MIELEHLRATRAAYDVVAVDYAELLRDENAAMPLDRALLGLFAELVLAGGDTRVADLGCGPGRLTGHLQLLGLDPLGIDLSPAMVAVARQTHPHLPFEVGSITDLELEGDSLGGALAWYSLIHTPPEYLPVVFAEFHRVLAPGGFLLVAFQVGDNERIVKDTAYGHDVTLARYRLDPDWIAQGLQAAGLTVGTRVLREPERQYETTQQAFLIAQKLGSQA